MHRGFGCIFFTLAVFLLFDFSNGQWIDYLCQNKEEIERNYSDSALVLLPSDFKDHENSTWRYRKLCVYNDEEVGKCMEIGLIVNGTEYPKKLRIHSDSTNDKYDLEMSKQQRVKRDADLPNEYFYGESSCRVANNLKTAEIMCKIFPSSIKCKSYCVYGMTFNEGIERLHTCNNKENKWSKDFEECRPFVDCNLKLISSGNLKCTGNEVKKNPWCQVQCDEYEDKAETKSQAYSCKANGKWQPPLPHCVQPKGIDLVKAPSVLEHGDLTYPK